MSIRKTSLVTVAPHSVAFGLLVAAEAFIMKLLSPEWCILVTASNVAALLYIANVIDRNCIALSDDGRAVRFRSLTGNTLWSAGGERLSIDCRLARLAVAVLGMVAGIGLSLPFVRWLGSTAALITLIVTFVGCSALAIVYDRELARRYLRRGILSQQAGYFESSLNDFSECIQLSLRHRFEATIARGYSWLKLGEFDRARESFTFAMNERPDSQVVEAAFYDASRIEFLQHFGEHDAATQCPALEAVAGPALDDVSLGRWV